MVLEAPAGRGKTTTLIQLAEQHLAHDELPFLIDLPSWNRSTIEVLEFVANRPEFRSRSICAEDLAKLFNAVHCSFLLNGWNEVSGTNSENAVQALRDMERSFPSAGIMVVTRAHHIKPPLPGSIQTKLLSLSRAQRTEYLDRRMGARAENEAASPWETYPRSVGVHAPSAVTIHCGENPHNFHDMESDAPGPILDKAASVMATLGSNNAPVSSAEFFVVLGPEHAATIAGAGWTRRDVQSYLYETARLPAGVFRRAFEAVQYRPWLRALGDDDAMPITDHPDNVRVLVAGGAGKHSCVIPSWGMTKSVTLPIEG